MQGSSHFVISINYVSMLQLYYDSNVQNARCKNVTVTACNKVSSLIE